MWFSKLFLLTLFLGSFTLQISAQLLSLPNPTNPTCMVGRQLGVTDIEIRYNSPGVKGRQGRIWGTPVAPFDFTVLGFGSNVASPWRAGADECTTISFSTDVRIQGKHLAAGKYALFMALYPDSVMLIFNRNHTAWGSYFYDASMDVLRVATIQDKNISASREWLEYNFSDQTSKSVQINLEWEHWRIPILVEVDLVNTTLAAIKGQMSGAMGFDPPSLQAAAQWCLSNDVNLDGALNWITSASDPGLGGLQTFPVLSTKAGILRKLGKTTEADQVMESALAKAAVLDLHAYGRQLISEKKYREALNIFLLNHQKHGDTWPVHVGLMRGYSGTGDLANALKHARIALSQAPDEVNRGNLQNFIQILESNKPISQ